MIPDTSHLVASVPTHPEKNVPQNSCNAGNVSNVCLEMSLNYINMTKTVY